MKKRILSLLLCLCMVLLMAPAAMATEPGEGVTNCPGGASCQHVAAINGTHYNTLNDAVASITDGSAGKPATTTTTIEILKEVDNAGGITIPSGKNITIDFDGHVYTLNAPGAGSQGTETNGFQLLKDSTIEMKNGTINIAADNMTPPDGSTPIKRIIQNYANLTLDNMQIYAANQYGGEDYALSFNCGNIKFTGDTDIITSSNDIIAFDVCKFASYESAKVTFDENYTGTVNGMILYDGQDSDKHSLTISGTGGNFGGISATKNSAENAKDMVNVSGGTFTTPISPDYCATDKAPLVNEDGSCVVKPTSELDNKKYSKNEDGTYYVSDEAAAADNEAKIGTTCYATLEEAVEAAGTNGVGTTIELLKNVVLDATGKPDTQDALTINKDLTINGNSHKISGTDFTAEGNEPGASLINIGTGNGTEDITVTLNNVKLDGGNTDTVNYDEGAKHGLNINSTGGTVNLNGVEITGCRWYAVVNNGATLNVNGLTTSGNQWGVNIDKGGSGTFNNANIEESASIVYETKDEDSSLTVKGGTYVNVEIKKDAKGNVSLTGGSFSGGITGDATENEKQEIVEISGGTYKDNVKAYLADGLVQNADGSVGKPYTPPANPSYSITTPAAENGKVTVSPTSAKAGAKVTITVTPDDGFELDELTVTRGSTAVTVTKNSDGTYSFTMPRGSVTVTATFVCDGGDKCPSAPFTDVNTSLWYHEEIDYVVENGLMNGDSPTTFAPQRELSRAELAQILYNKEGRPAVEGDMVFADVPAGEWFYPAILWANQEEVVGGDSPTTFVPNRAITREELAVMLYRYAGKPAASGSLKDFTDGDEVSTWAEDAMVWAVTEGIISGDTPTTLDPGDGATRAEAAAMLMRFCENVEQ